MSVQCRFYRIFIDPLLRALRKRMAEMIPDGASVLEAACGTGEQSLILAGKAGRVVGFDYNGTMAECARRRGLRSSGNVSFLEADARNLPFVTDGEYDYATITLALHEMNEDTRVPVLMELSRTARYLLVADYSSPLPPTLTGRFTWLIERLAGREHYAGFCSYQSSGGLDAMLGDADLKIVEEYSVLGGIVRILLCSTGIGLVQFHGK